MAGDNIGSAVIDPTVNNVPGRKTDAAGCTWLAELLECGPLRGSYIPVQKIAELRDLTRYRAKLVGSRTSEIQRLSKTLEDARLTELREEDLKLSGQVRARVCTVAAHDRNWRSSAGSGIAGGAAARVA